MSLVVNIHMWEDTKLEVVTPCRGFCCVKIVSKDIPSHAAPVIFIDKAGVAKWYEALAKINHHFSKEEVEKKEAEAEASSDLGRLRDMEDRQIDLWETEDGE